MKYIAVISLCLTLTVSSTKADRDDFLINDDGQHVEQNQPAVAVAADGSFVVTWVDKRGGNADIYLQRFDHTGYPIGDNRKTNDDLVEAYQSEPAIATDLSGQYSLVFKDYRNGQYPFDPDIFFQRFDTTVAEIDANRNLTIEKPDSLKESPDISLGTYGTGVVVWADYRNRNWDIYGQRFSPGGNLEGSNFKVNNDAGLAQQHAPRVSVSPEGWFVVTWYDNRWGNDDIYFQRFDSLATPIGVNVKVNTDGSTSRQAFPDVAADGAGHFTVVWVDWRNGSYPSNPDIYARKFDTLHVPLGSETKINRDVTLRAQREPTIAADRLGNVAIIWSDSIARSWDIVGQMIDVTGVVREANFQANTHSDSAQLQADVALDGRYRYVTWADKRNGDYDIYASITKYNDPTLITSPTTLKFEMEYGGGLPDSQIVGLDHAGYNSLSYRATTDAGWCLVTPALGNTPAQLAVSIADSLLGRGTYLATIELEDLDNSVVSTTISVRLDVTSPFLTLSADSLQIESFAGLPDTIFADLTVSNSGSGSFVWQATAADWLILENSDGNDGDTIRVGFCAHYLTGGDYTAPILFEATGALNSPDTVWAIFKLTDNMPYLRPVPDSIFLQTIAPLICTSFVAVQNFGVGSLDWSATIDHPWLIPGRLAGTDNDSIQLTIDTTALAFGRHLNRVTITDSSTFNKSVRIPFILNYVPAIDTVRIGTVQLAQQESTTIPVELILCNPADGFYLPLVFDSAMISIDSVTFNAALIDSLTMDADIDAAGRLSLSGTSATPDSPLESGTRLLASIHLTSGDRPGQTELGLDSLSGEQPWVTTSPQLKVVPEVLPGIVQVGTQTSVEQNEPVALPDRVTLQQNYPNPFNAMTRIDFHLPTGAEVKLDVYNILGQKIAGLVSGHLDAGSHTVSWESDADETRQIATGIYFYRLETGHTVRVRKAVLIK